jgi:hypothetical protein
MRAWKPGDRLRHRDNAELGPGRVLEAGSRSLIVEFPRPDLTLTFANDAEALVPLVLGPGIWARLDPDGARVLIDAPAGSDRWRLAGGRVVAGTDLWPLDVADSPLDLLAQGEIAPVEELALRLDALQTGWVRSSAAAFGSFPTSSTSRKGQPAPIPCAGCWPTKSASERRSRPV